MGRSSINQRWSLAMIRAGIVGLMKFTKRTGSEKGSKGIVHYGYDSLGIGLYFINSIYNMTVTGEGENKSVTWVMKSMVELDSSLKRMLKDLGESEFMWGDEGFNADMKNINSRLSTIDNMQELLRYSAHLSGSYSKGVSEVNSIKIKVGSITSDSENGAKYFIRVADDSFGVKDVTNLILTNKNREVATVTSINKKVIVINFDKIKTISATDLVLKPEIVKLLKSEPNYKPKDSDYIEVDETILHPDIAKKKEQDPNFKVKETDYIKSNRKIKKYIPFVTEKGEELTLSRSDGKSIKTEGPIDITVSETEYIELFENLLEMEWKNGDWTKVAGSGHKLIEEISELLNSVQENFDKKYNTVEASIQYVIDFVEKEINKLIALRPWISNYGTASFYKDNPPDAVVPSVEGDDYNYAYQNKHQSTKHLYKRLVDASYIPNTYLKITKKDVDRDEESTKELEDRAKNEYEDEDEDLYNDRADFSNLTVTLVENTNKNTNKKPSTSTYGKVIIDDNYSLVVVDGLTAKKISRIAGYLLYPIVDKSGEILIEIKVRDAVGNSEQMVRKIHTNRELVRTTLKDFSAGYSLKFFNGPDSSDNKVEVETDFNVNTELAKSVWPSNTSENLQAFLDDLRGNLATFRKLSKKYTPDFLKQEFGEVFYKEFMKDPLEIGKSNKNDKHGGTTFTYFNMINLEKKVLEYKNTNIESEDVSIQNKIILDTATLLIYKIQHVDYVYRYYHLVELLTDFILYLYPLVDSKRFLSKEAPYLPLIGVSGGRNEREDKKIVANYLDVRKIILENPNIVEVIMKTLKLESISSKLESLILLKGDKLNIKNAFLDLSNKVSLKEISNDIMIAAKNKDLKSLEDFEKIYVKGKSSTSFQVQTIKKLLERAFKIVNNKFDVEDKAEKKEIMELINKRVKEQFKTDSEVNQMRHDRYKVIANAISKSDIDTLENLYDSRIKDLDLTDFSDIKEDIARILNNMEPSNKLKSTLEKLNIELTNKLDLITELSDIINVIIGTEGLFGDDIISRLEEVSKNNVYSKYSDIAKNIISSSIYDEESKLYTITIEVISDDINMLSDDAVETKKQMEDNVLNIEKQIDEYVKDKKYDFDKKTATARLHSEFSTKAKNHKDLVKHYAELSKSFDKGKELFNQIDTFVRYGTSKISDHNLKDVINRLLNLKDRNNNDSDILDICNRTIKIINLDISRLTELNRKAKSDDAKEKRAEIINNFKDAINKLEILKKSLRDFTLVNETLTEIIPIIKAIITSNSGNERVLDISAGLIKGINTIIPNNEGLLKLYKVIDDAKQYIMDNGSKKVNAEDFMVKFNYEEELTPAVIKDMENYDIENDSHILNEVTKAIDDENLVELTKLHSKVKGSSLRTFIKHAAAFVKKLTIDMDFDDTDDDILDISKLFSGFRTNTKIIKLATILFPKESNITVDFFKTELYNIYSSINKSKIDELVNIIETKIDDKTRRDLSKVIGIVYLIQEKIYEIRKINPKKYDMGADVLSTLDSDEISTFRKTDSKYKDLIHRISLSNSTNNIDDLILIRTSLDKGEYPPKTKDEDRKDKDIELLFPTTIKTEIINNINSILEKKKISVDPELERYMLSNEEYGSLSTRFNTLSSWGEGKTTNEYLKSLVVFKGEIKSSKIISKAKDFLINQVEYLITQEYKKNNQEYIKLSRDVQEAIDNSDFDKLYSIYDSISTSGLQFNVKFELHNIIDDFIAQSKLSGNDEASKIEKLRNDVKWAISNNHYETLKSWNESATYSKYNNVKSLLEKGLLDLSKQSTISTRAIGNIVDVLKSGRISEIRELLDKYNLFPGVIDLVQDVLDYLDAKEDNKMSDFNFDSYDLDKIKYQMWKKDEKVAKVLNSRKIGAVKNSINQLVKELNSNGLESLLKQTNKYPTLNKLVKDALIFVLTKQILPVEYHESFGKFDVNQLDSDISLGEPGEIYADVIDYSSILTNDVLSKIKTTINNYVVSTNIAGLTSLIKKYSKYPEITTMINDAIEYTSSQVLTQSTIKAIKSYLNKAIEYANDDSIRRLDLMMTQYSGYDKVVDMIRETKKHINLVKGLNDTQRKGIEKPNLDAYQYSELSTPNKTSNISKFIINNYDNSKLAMSPTSITINSNDNEDSQTKALMKAAKRTIQQNIESENIDRLNKLLNDENIKTHLELVNMINNGIKKIENTISSNNNTKNIIMSDAGDVNKLTTYLKDPNLKQHGEIISNLLKLNKMVDDSQNDLKSLKILKSNPEFSNTEIQSKINKYLKKLDPNALYSREEILDTINEYLSLDDIKNINLLRLSINNRKFKDLNLLNDAKKAIESNEKININLSTKIIEMVRKLFSNDFSSSSLSISGRMLSVSNIIDDLFNMKKDDRDSIKPIIKELKSHKTIIDALFKKEDDKFEIDEDGNKKSLNQLKAYSNTITSQEIDKATNTIVTKSTPKIINFKVEFDGLFDEYINFLMNIDNSDGIVGGLYNLEQADKNSYNQLYKELSTKLGALKNELNHITNSLKNKLRDYQKTLFEFLDKISVENPKMLGLRDRLKLILNPTSDSENENQYNKLRASDKLLTDFINTHITDDIKTSLDNIGDKILTNLLNEQDIRELIMDSAEVSSGMEQFSQTTEKMTRLQNLITTTIKMVEFEYNTLRKLNPSDETYDEDMSRHVIKDYRTLRDIPSKLNTLVLKIRSIILEKFKQSAKK